MPPDMPKKDLKLLRLILYAGASLAFLGAGTFSVGLLWREERIFIAILLFLTTVAGAAGSLFFFFTVPSANIFEAERAICTDGSGRPPGDWSAMAFRSWQR
jgi:hypothetical protein